MSMYETEIDEALWERYLSDCRALSEGTATKVTPSIKDFLVWRDEQDIDE